MKLIPSWPPRDWRMFFALAGLAVAGAGAWLLSKWSLDELVKLAVEAKQVWPVAYFAYGALAILAIPSLLFGVVVGLKSFSWEGPMGTKGKLEGDDE